MIDIVIPMHNAMDFSQRCVNSVRVTLADIPYKIHILNNGSTDGTAEWLAQLAEDDVEIQSVPQNLGAPKGKNIILNHVQPSDYVLFIDNDIELFPGWYELFTSVFAQHQQVGVVGIEGYNITVHEEHRELHPLGGTPPVPCDILRGCFMLACGELVRKLSRFDENCGLYWHDDDDFCVRATGEGYQNYWLPTEKVVHYGSRSSVTTFPDVRDFGESARVQRYLAGKWRSLGFIGSDGRPRPRG